MLGNIYFYLYFSDIYGFYFNSKLTMARILTLTVFLRAHVHKTRPIS